MNNFNLFWTSFKKPSLLKQIWREKFLKVLSLLKEDTLRQSTKKLILKPHYSLGKFFSHLISTYLRDTFLWFSKSLIVTWLYQFIKQANKPAQELIEAFYPINKYYSLWGIFLIHYWINWPFKYRIISLEIPFSHVNGQTTL